MVALGAIRKRAAMAWVNGMENSRFPSLLFFMCRFHLSGPLLSSLPLDIVVKPLASGTCRVHNVVLHFCV